MEAAAQLFARRGLCAYFKKNFSTFLLLSCTFCASRMVIAAQDMQAQSTTSDSGESGAAQPFPAAPSADNTVQRAPAVPKLRGGQASVKANRTIPTEPDTTEDDSRTTSPPSKTARPLSAPSDFQIFAEEAAGRPLAVYGRELFEEVPSTFAPMDHIPVPAGYAIGPGDELLIRAWGKIDLDARVVVDRNGQISLPKVGTLNVAGLRYEQLEGYLRTAIGNLYKDFELNVVLGRLRSIQILVLGNARQPGSYTLGSLSTLVDALFASGGPSSTGTMRHIQLRRDGRVMTDFDLYDLQQKGDKSGDIQLLSGDEIYIPPIGPQVAIVGNVDQPGIYELKGATTVASALEGAGGLTNLAATARVLLERVENHSLRRVDEFALDGAGLQRMLRDGDLLRIFPISPQFANAVTIRGNVAAPGRFPWHEGMRISDLIPSRAFLITSEHWGKQNHLADEQHTDMMVDVAEASAEVNWDYAVIERLDEHDLSTRLIPFNLGNAIDDPTSSQNQLLKIGDVVTIFSRRDLPLPVEKHATFVRLAGEVNAPGVYRVNPGETLRDAVARAGGLTPHSYLYASQLTRVSAREVQQAQLKLSVGRMQKELSSQYASAPHTLESTNAAQGAAYERIPASESPLTLQQSLIAELAKARPAGRVVLGISRDAKTAADIPDMPLEDGDDFYVPPIIGTVQVIGEVYNESAFRYQPRKSLSAYLNDSGGATRLADLKRIFLIRADGTIVSGQSGNQRWPHNFGKIALMPGDAIVVPPKIKTGSGFMQELPLITQILSQTAMTGAVLSLIQ
jgi:protein involved in polysaccharide export with SLBB domain